MRKSIFFVVVPLLILFGTNCIAREKLVFGAVENTPPYVFEENDKLVGIAVDIFKETQIRAGFEAIIQPLPAKRMVLFGTLGKIDGFIQSHLNSSRKTIIYSSIPGYESMYSLFMKKGDEHKFTGSKLTDLNGKRVGWKRGYGFTKEMSQAIENGNFIVEVVNASEQNLKKLINNRIDCFIDNHYAVMYLIKTMNLKDRISYSSSPFFPKKGIYMAIGKKGTGIKDKKIFMDKLNAALESIHQDHTVDKIVRKYIDN
ncbi:substrate-binding periplasmic protein [Desulfospira joergensenii]|uniref:substrate-binding periplasmic protein n=1 Tax=Desulfospira joergensenii TaxID=53329 RepID=UPI0003B49E73|nr:transporter substrate-binding domain-containing protein [Desulfospira joergensenii]